MIAPSYVKIPKLDIYILMQRALKAVQMSNSLIIIGCSLRREDTFLRQLITHFFLRDDWQNRHVLIVDPNAENISNTLRAFWGGLVNNNIVPFAGPLEESATDLLRYFNPTP